MTRIKDLSKALGLIGRGGRFFPSNEASQEKWDEVFAALEKATGIEARPSCIEREELGMFRQFAKEAGYTVVIIEKGLGR